MEKINIAELLKDCPKCMELYSPLCGDCRVSYIYDGLSFDVVCGDNTVYNFLYDGRFNIMGECCIFPSKENRDWNKFRFELYSKNKLQRQFKDGDIIYTSTDGLKCGIKTVFISIFKECSDNKYRIYACYSINTNSFYPHHTTDTHLCNVDDIIEQRLATEEEKDLLFRAIKNNGYKWNPETRTLDEIPKIKDGDIIYTKTSSSEWVSIFEKFDDDECKCYIDYCIDSDTYYGKIGGKKNPLCYIDEIVEQRLATEEEKQKLFDAIEEHGHRWNIETKTLVKLVQPKFKIGNVIQDIDAYRVKITEVNLEDECYEYESTFAKGIGSIPFSEQDNWKLVPDVKPIFKVGDNITKIDGSRKGEIFYIDVDKYHVAVSNNIGIDVFFEDQDDWKLIPNKFDINTLKPFDKVLVRDSDKEYWGINLFGFYNEITKQFHCMGNSNIGWNECIPYEGNEHLLGTTNNCDKYYKTWE